MVRVIILWQNTERMQHDTLKFAVGYPYGDHKIIYITIADRDLKP